ncbi:MAG: UbiA prenyltransferase family protein [Firmicutes bacterium]|nr:UbiA prenyltransferase family protein [Bacillota bacterium]
MAQILSLLRIKHWIKNLIVWTPLCFVGIEKWGTLIHLLNVFVSFCLSASIIYIINDLVDRKSDLLHPLKKFRPIACGRVKPYQALLVLLLLGALLISIWMFTGYFNPIVILYIILNMFYSFWLKAVPIVDLMVVSLCYVLRLSAGFVTLSIDFPFWLLVAIYFFALSIITGKRRSEIIQVEKKKAHRSVLGQYNLDFLNYIILISSIIALNSYVIFVYVQFNQNHSNLGMIFSMPLILFSVLKYLYNIFIMNQGGDPVEEIIRDKSLLVSVFSFVLITVIFTSMKIVNVLEVASWFR